MKHRIIKKTSVFPADKQQIWERLKRLSTLQHIARPYAIFTPANGEKSFAWKEGERFQLKLKLFGMISLGIHEISVEQFDSSSYSIYTKEQNSAVPVWNHRIYLKSIDNNSTEYTDEVEIYAGWKTCFVLIWAKLFYAHPQRRWVQLLREQQHE